jgi:hypothetical protein
LLDEQYGCEAHSQYNALLRRVISFASALEREHQRAWLDVQSSQSPI